MPFRVKTCKSERDQRQKVHFSFNSVRIYSGGTSEGKNTACCPRNQQLVLILIYCIFPYSFVSSCCSLRDKAFGFLVVQSVDGVHVLSVTFTYLFSFWISELLMFCNKSGCAYIFYCYSCIIAVFTLFFFNVSFCRYCRSWNFWIKASRTFYSS